MKTSRLAALLALALLVLGLQVPAHAAVPGPVSGRIVAPAGTSPRDLVVELVDLRNLRRSVSTRPDANGRFSIPGGERPELFAVRVCEAGGKLCKHVSTRIAELGDPVEDAELGE